MSQQHHPQKDHASKTKQEKLPGKHDRTKHVSPAESAQNKPFNDVAAKASKKALHDSANANKSKVNDGDGVGEGNQAAARRYNEGLAKSEQRGDSDELAERAKDALDGTEAEDLRRAESEGMVSHTPQKS